MHTVVKFLESPMKFALGDDKVVFGRNITASWAIPEDQATHKDWIGMGWRGEGGRD